MLWLELEGKFDVQKGGHGLDGARMLRVIDEIALTRHKVLVPFENVKLCVGKRLHAHSR